MSSDESSAEAADQLGLQLAFVLEMHAPVLVADAGGAGDDHLEAAGVGHEGLAAVDRPHVGRRGRAHERPDAQHGLEQQVRPGRIRDRIATADEDPGQPGGDFLHPLQVRRRV